MNVDGLPDRFLFINKSAHSKSLSHSNADEHFDIQSHVQSRNKKKDSIFTPTTKISSHLRLHTKCVFSQVTNRRSSRTKAGGKNGGAPPMEGGAMKQSDRASNSHRSSLQQLSVKQMPSLSVTCYTYDPFGSASIPMDAATHHLLNYPFTGFLERTFKAEALCLQFSGPEHAGNFRHRQAMGDRLRCCVEDPLAMYATLSYSANCVRWATGQNEGQNPPEFFTLKAIERLRDRLENPQTVDRYLIISIYALGAAEMWNENPHGARAHLTAVRDCVVRWGGMNKLDPYIRESLILADKYTALLGVTQPVLPLDWDPGLLSEEKHHKVLENERCSSNALGQDFLCCGADVGLNPNLLAIIGDILQCVNFAQFYSPLGDEDEEWLFLRHQSFIYRLLSLNTDAESLDECCRLALITWLLKITAYFGAQRASKRLLPRLKSALLAIITGHDRQKIDQNQTKILFWITSVGAMTAEYTKERDWFIAETSRLAESLQLSLEREPFRSFLERYLFLDCEGGLNFKRMVRAIRELRGEAVPYV